MLLATRHRPPTEQTAVTAPRRYSEDEIALILQQAGAAQERSQDETGTTAFESGPTPYGTGLTLAQLQEIGSEVGISAMYIERAADAVERGLLVPTQQRRWLGMPVGVSRTIDFGRSVTDDEWDRIVVTLRETFEARGRLQHDGAFRQWTNGNLQALLEPTSTGHRLRLATRRGDAASRVTLGGIFLVLSVAMWSALVFRDHVTAATMVVPGFFSVMGAATLLSVRLQLPKWAQTRASQMESIAQRMLDANKVLPKAVP